MPVAAQLEGSLHSIMMAQLTGQRFSPCKTGEKVGEHMEKTGM